MLEQHANLLRSAFPDHVRRIQASAQQFDFDDALAALREAAAGAGLALA